MKDTVTKIINVIITLLLFISSSCKNNQRLEYALAFASDNRPELVEVLTYYKDDSFKTEVTYFLIKNMPHYLNCTGHVLDKLRSVQIMRENCRTI